MPHPDHLPHRLTDRQLDDWAAYAAVEPFGCPAEDARAGLLAWAAHSPHTRQPKRRTPAEYAPRWSPPRRSAPLSGEGYKAKALATYAAVGSVVTVPG